MDGESSAHLRRRHGFGGGKRGRIRLAVGHLYRSAAQDNRPIRPHYDGSAVKNVREADGAQRDFRAVNAGADSCSGAVIGISSVGSTTPSHVVVKLTLVYAERISVFG